MHGGVDGDVVGPVGAGAVMIAAGEADPHLTLDELVNLRLVRTTLPAPPARPALPVKTQLWRPLMEAGDLPWLAALGRDWDLVTMPAAEWEQLDVSTGSATRSRRWMIAW